MASKTGVTVTPQVLTAKAGDTVEADISLHNQGQSINQLVISVEGLSQNWYSLPVSSVALFPNDKDNLKLVLNAPGIIDGISSYPFRVKVSSQSEPDNAVTVDLSLEIQVLPELELSISPASSKGRRGNYLVNIANPGSNEVKVQLQARDTHGSLQYNLEPEDVTVPAGGKVEARLEAELGWLSSFGGDREFDFEVLATPMDSEESKSAAAKLVRVAWYRMLPRVRVPRRLLAIFQRPPVITSFSAETEDNVEFKLGWSVKRSKDIMLDGDPVGPQGEKTISPEKAASVALTAKNKYGSTSRTVDLEPRFIPTARTSDHIRLTVSSSDISCQADGVPEIISVGLQNLGETVDKFTVTIQGLDEAWYSRSASSVALMPQASEQMQITFHPPKKKGTKARVYPFAITVSSQNAPDDSATVTGQITVLPLVEYKMKAAPYRVSSRGKARFRISVANMGTSDARLNLGATDLEEGLNFKFNPGTTVVVPAWKSIEIPVIVKPKKGRRVGPRRRFDITFTTSTEDGNTQTANGELDFRPVISSWGTIFRTVRILIFVGIIAGLIGFLIHWGGGFTLLRTSPQTWWNQLADQFVNTFGGWFSAN